MLQKALAAKSQIGPSHMILPLEENVRQRSMKPPKAGTSVAGAGFFTEDDFELGEEFLDAFTRASERVAGFVVGCALIGVAWLAFSLI